VAAEEAVTAEEPAEAASEPDGEPVEEIVTVLPGEIAATAEQVATTH
jgi:type IV secretory pathway VirB2 component (pilin)